MGINIEVKKQLNHNYLIIRTDNIKSYNRFKTIDSETLSGIVPFIVQRINNNIEFIYEISSGISIENKYSDEMLEAADIKKILKSYLDVLDICDEYMIEKSFIMLCPDIIFIKDSEVRFCLFAATKCDIEKEFKKLLDWMLLHVDYNDEEAVKMIYQINARSIREGFDADLIRSICNIKEEKKDDFYSKAQEEDIKTFYDIKIPNTDSAPYKTQNVDFANNNKLKGDNEKQTSKDKKYRFNLQNILMCAIVVVFIFSLTQFFGIRIDFKMLIGAFISIALLVYVYYRNKERLRAFKDIINDAKKEINAERALEDGMTYEIDNVRSA